MSIPPDPRLSGCPQSDAEASPPTLGRSSHPAAGPAWYVVAFTRAGRAVHLAGGRPPADDPDQLPLPEPTEFFDPRQTHFEWPAGGAEGGAL